MIQNQTLLSPDTGKKHSETQSPLFVISVERISPLFSLLQVQIFQGVRDPANIRRNSPANRMDAETNDIHALKIACAYRSTMPTVIVPAIASASTAIIGNTANSLNHAGSKPACTIDSGNGKYIFPDTFRSVSIVFWIFTVHKNFPVPRSHRFPPSCPYYRSGCSCLPTNSSQQFFLLQPKPTRRQIEKQGIQISLKNPITGNFRSIAQSNFIVSRNKRLKTNFSFSFIAVPPTSPC